MEEEIEMDAPEASDMPQVDLPAGSASHEAVDLPAGSASHEAVEEPKPSVTPPPLQSSSRTTAVVDMPAGSASHEAVEEPKRSVTPPPLQSSSRTTAVESSKHCVATMRTKRTRKTPWKSYSKQLDEFQEKTEKYIESVIIYRLEVLEEIMAWFKKRLHPKRAASMKKMSESCDTHGTDIENLVFILEEFGRQCSELSEDIKKLALVGLNMKLYCQENGYPAAYLAQVSYEKVENKEALDVDQLEQEVEAWNESVKTMTDMMSWATFAFSQPKHMQTVMENGAFLLNQLISLYNQQVTKLQDNNDNIPLFMEKEHEYSLKLDRTKRILEEEISRIKEKESAISTIKNQLVTAHQSQQSLEAKMLFMKAESSDLHGKKIQKEREKRMAKFQKEKQSSQTSETISCEASTELEESVRGPALDSVMGVQKQASKPSLEKADSKDEAVHEPTIVGPVSDVITPEILVTQQPSLTEATYPGAAPDIRRTRSSSELQICATISRDRAEYHVPKIPVQLLEQTKGLKAKMSQQELREEERHAEVERKRSESAERKRSPSMIDAELEQKKSELVDLESQWRQAVNEVDRKLPASAEGRVKLLRKESHLYKGLVDVLQITAEQLKYKVSELRSRRLAQLGDPSLLPNGSLTSSDLDISLRSPPYRYKKKVAPAGERSGRGTIESSPEHKSKRPPREEAHKEAHKLESSSSDRKGVEQAINLKESSNLALKKQEESSVASGSGLGQHFRLLRRKSSFKDYVTSVKMGSLETTRKKEGLVLPFNQNLPNIRSKQAFLNALKRMNDTTQKTDKRGHRGSVYKVVKEMHENIKKTDKQDHSGNTNTSAAGTADCDGEGKKRGKTRSKAEDDQSDTNRVSGLEEKKRASSVEHGGSDESLATCSASKPDLNRNSAVSGDRSLNASSSPGPENQSSEYQQSKDGNPSSDLLGESKQEGSAVYPVKSHSFTMFDDIPEDVLQFLVGVTDSGEFFSKVRECEAHLLKALPPERRLSTPKIWGPDIELYMRQGVETAVSCYLELKDSTVFFMANAGLWKHTVNTNQLLGEELKNHINFSDMIKDLDENLAPALQDFVCLVSNAIREIYRKFTPTDSEMLFLLKNTICTLPSGLQNWKESNEKMKAKKQEYSSLVRCYCSLWSSYNRVRAELCMVRQKETVVPPTAESDEVLKQQQKEEGEELLGIFKAMPRVTPLLPSIKPRPNASLPRFWKQELELVKEASKNGVIPYQEYMEQVYLCLQMAMLLQLKIQTLGSTYPELRAKQILNDKVKTILRELGQNKAKLRTLKKKADSHYASMLEGMDRLEKSLWLQHEATAVNVAMAQAHMKVRNKMRRDMCLLMDTISEGGDSILESTEESEKEEEREWRERQFADSKEEEQRKREPCGEVQEVFDDFQEKGLVRGVKIHVIPTSDSNQDLHTLVGHAVAERPADQSHLEMDIETKSEIGSAERDTDRGVSEKSSRDSGFFPDVIRPQEIRRRTMEKREADKVAPCKKSSHKENINKVEVSPLFIQGKTPFTRPEESTSKQDQEQRMFFRDVSRKSVCKVDLKKKRLAKVPYLFGTGPTFQSASGVYGKGKLPTFNRGLDKGSFAATKFLAVEEMKTKKPVRTDSIRVVLPPINTLPTSLSPDYYRVKVAGNINIIRHAPFRLQTNDWLRTTDLQGSLASPPAIQITHSSTDAQEAVDCTDTPETVDGFPRNLHPSYSSSYSSIIAQPVESTSSIYLRGSWILDSSASDVTVTEHERLEIPSAPLTMRAQLRREAKQSEGQVMPSLVDHFGRPKSAIRQYVLGESVVKKEIMAPKLTVSPRRDKAVEQVRAWVDKSKAPEAATCKLPTVLNYKKQRKRQKRFVSTMKKKARSRLLSPGRASPRTSSGKRTPDLETPSLPDILESRLLCLDVDQSRRKASRILQMVNDRRLPDVLTTPSCQHIWNKYQTTPTAKR